MENAGFEREDTAALTPGGGASGAGGRVATVELREVESSPPSVPAPELLSVNGRGGATCSAHCQALHLQHQLQYAAKAAEAEAAGAGGRPAQESPWHHLKTVFLVGTLIFLALWIVVYTLLSQLAVF